MINDVNYISVEDLKEHLSMSNHIEPSILVPFIRSSEKMHVGQVLGTALDTELKNAITGNTLTDAQQLLIQYYIKPYACWSTYSSSITFLAYKPTPKGVMKQNSDNSTNIDAGELNILKQAIKDNTSFFRKELIDYLECNKDVFPLYRSCNKSTDYSNGIYLGKNDKNKFNGRY